ncbi:branched-chain amino acid transport system permease protein [Mesorhizobium sp. YL-MeA3-2017]|uniref:branched-chain amino acid ABC transporter permease n=1 Tax=Mesorhizobium TaxID=68287 RepID=UPI0015CD6C30|nr:MULTISPECIES: branched-chain amino acid ABC transporter permease [Mesorhizobium]MBN9235699.1 branched-chain amino acid ABC transporter permease [Mesorhizobium sp.]MDQ0332963.1 branched-chain amino acid transport system permease protein [Mesorhizobium sp. YL-MeA3-2017]
MALLPLAAPGSYVLGQATLFGIWAAVVTQWNLVLGVAGIMSIGQMALFAAGGYAVALLGLYFSISPWWSLPIAGLAGTAVSLLMGGATLRLKGAYVVVVTLAVAMVLYQLIVTDVDCFRKVEIACYSLTGGARGLTRFGDFGFARLFGYKFVATADYLLALACLALGTVFAIVVVHSPYGRAFQAMRDNEVCAAARGIDVAKYQLIVFALAGFFTGLAGGIYAGTMKTFGPQVLELPTLLFLLSMMIVGGRGRVWGPILGTIALALVDESFRDLAQWRNTAFAVVLMLMLVFMPEGLAGGLARFFSVSSPLIGGVACRRRRGWARS